MRTPLRPGAQISLLTIPFSPATGAFENQPLADFLTARDLLSSEQHFFTHADLPFILLVIAWQPSAPATSEPSPKTRTRETTRPAVELTAPDRERFEFLRAWRTERAQADGVPPYVIFTNRELQALVLACPTSNAALAKIPGIGAGKIARYGEAILATLASWSETAPPTTDEGADGA